MSASGVCYTIQDLKVGLMNMLPFLTLNVAYLLRPTPRVVVFLDWIIVFEFLTLFEWTFLNALFNFVLVVAQWFFWHRFQETKIVKMLMFFRLVIHVRDGCIVIQ